MKKLHLVLASLVILGVASHASAQDERWADYKSWTPINTKPITGDHSGFLDGKHKAKRGVRITYVNDIGKEVALGDGPYIYPVGTVFVKEQYGSQAKFEKGKQPPVTVSVKVSDDAANPAENWAWSWGYKRKAKVEEGGGFCSKCHTIAIADDFSFSNATTLKDFR